MYVIEPRQGLSPQKQVWVCKFHPLLLENKMDPLCLSYEDYSVFEIIKSNLDWSS